MGLPRPYAGSGIYPLDRGGRLYSDAYMINWKSNVFPGILGRTCDRPCEPACRRGRVEDEPVAICRLKRVAADHKEDIRHRLPPRAAASNGKRIAFIGGGPASLTVARDLAPLGYECTVFDRDPNAGGMMRTQIPNVPPADCRARRRDRVRSQPRGQFRRRRLASKPKASLDEGMMTVFVGSGAPRGRDLDVRAGRKREECPHRHRMARHVSFGHTTQIGKRVVVLGAATPRWTAAARRAASAANRSPSWSLRLRGDEGVSLGEGGRHARGPSRSSNFMVAERVHPRERQVTGVVLREGEGGARREGPPHLVPTGEPDQHIPCDDVLVAVGQENAFPWIERDIGIVFDKWNMPVVDEKTMLSTRPGVFFGGDAAFGPKNIIWAVAHGHEAAISIHQYCQGEDIAARPAPGVTIVSQKMGIHEWSYDNEIVLAERYKVPLREKDIALKDLRTEVELGYDPVLALKEAERCLNCDVQTVFTGAAASSAMPASTSARWDCITFTRTVRSTSCVSISRRPPAINLRTFTSRQSQDRPL